MQWYAAVLLTNYGPRHSSICHIIESSMDECFALLAQSLTCDSALARRNVLLLTSIFTLVSHSLTTFALSVFCDVVASCSALTSSLLLVDCIKHLLVNFLTPVQYVPAWVWQVLIA